MIKICHLYSNVMSTYGDRGNVEYLRYFLQRHGAEVEVNDHHYSEIIPEADIYIFGGGQDSAEILVSRDLQQQNGEILRGYLTEKYCLAVCGGYQLLGQYYLTKENEAIPGIGFLPIITVAGQERMIGHVVGTREFNGQQRTVVGFENHSGRTHILNDSPALLQVEQGSGNNGMDGGEGIVFQRTIGTYLHGPALPRNPHLVYWWLKDLIDAPVERPQLEMEKLAHQRIVESYR